MSKIKNPWGDGRDAYVPYPECAWRSCLHISENKGTFAQGRGYTSYYKNPKLVCMQNHLYGCPTPIPPIDPAKVLCCEKPDLPRARNSNPEWQRCRSCKTRLLRKRLLLVREIIEYGSR